MADPAPSPQSTLVVLLGASEWPKWATLNQELSDKDQGSAEAFAGSAEGVRAYFLDKKQFNLPKENLLNLFDSEGEPAAQLRRLTEFLKERINALKETSSPATDFIIYYVGHGGFVGDDFYLVIHKSEDNNKIASSLRPKSLAEIIKEQVCDLRCFLLIDSCYAGRVANAFENAPLNGVSLLCSSASDKTSRRAGRYTMFSGALLQTLQKGDKEGPERYSLRQLRDEAWREIRRQHGEENGVMPVVLSPVQRREDIAELSLFPNIGRRPVEGRERFVAKNNVAQCYVIESATEEKLRTNPALRLTVRSALLKYKEKLSNVIGKELDTTPVAVNVDRVIASQAGFENAIQALCQAEIAVFDVTNYEPVVMLLLGIRSVVRRGVTIASAGGNYVIGDPINYPFSIKEVNIISHSKEQGKSYHPIDLIGDKMIEGFVQLRYLPNYLDLPVFDAIRTLPPETEQRIPKEHTEQVLMLCPFSRRYTENNWKEYLKPQLGVYLPSIIRTLDMKSPRLVSQSLYEAMRLTQMCIVDWTEWRPNVFFELGIRLAAVDIDPVCIIETTHKEFIEELADTEDCNQRLEQARAKLKDDQNTENNDTVEGYTREDLERFVYAPYQSRRLLELFDLIEYRAPKSERIDEEDLEPYQKMVSYHESSVSYSELMRKGEDQHNPRKNCLPPSFTYRTVSRHIDGDMEVSAFPVHDELIRAANLLNDPQIDSDGRSPVLYPNNELLTRNANEGALERRLAAWYYIDNRLQNKLTEDQTLQRKFKDLGNLLARTLLRSPQGGDKEMAQRIRQRVKELKG